MTEQKRFPELSVSPTYHAWIPLIEGYEDVISEVDKNDVLKEAVANYATRIAKSLGLEAQDTLFRPDMGLANIGVFPSTNASISISGDSWGERKSKRPEFATNNVDTPEQYIALTSAIFFYLNRLQQLVDQKEA